MKDREAHPPATEPSPPNGAVDDRWLSEQELMDGAADAGLTPPSRAQLRRWRRAGLIPRSRQVHQEGVAGSVGLYPPRTLPQLLALLTLHDEQKSLSEICFELWWRGFPIEVTQLVRAIRELTRRDRELAAKLRQTGSDASEVADELITQLDDGKPRAPLARLIRHRLDSSDEELRSFLYFLTVLGYGGELDWDNLDASHGEELSPKENLLRGLGFARAMTDGSADVEPWLPEPPNLHDLFEGLRTAGGLTLTDPSSVFDSASDQELTKAREDARRIRVLAEICAAAETAFGRDALGLGGLSLMYRDEASVRQRIEILIAGLIARRVVSDEIIDDLLNAVVREGERARAYLRIIQEFPEYKRFLTRNGIERLELLSENERERIRSDISEFVERNPEIAQAIEE